MKKILQQSMKKDLIEEARRYVDNARDALADNGRYNKELKLYEDEKYVRAAGHYLWHAVLMALDAVFHVRADRRTRVDIDDYRQAVGKRDRKAFAMMDLPLPTTLSIDALQCYKTDDHGRNHHLSHQRAPQ